MIQPDSVCCGQFGQDRIRVNCICPGGRINTPIGGATTERSVQALSRRSQSSARDNRKIANMALFLASDESEWITGTSMLVDGGFMARAQSFGNFSTAEWSGSTGFVGPSFQLR